MKTNEVFHPLGAPPQPAVDDQISKATIKILENVIADCGPSCGQPDKARIAITICIEAGTRSGPAIVASLHRVGFKKQFVGLMLHKLMGPNPMRHDWFKDGQGLYHLHNQADAELKI